jgi:sugar lactone lactonase YvrE
MFDEYHYMLNVGLPLTAVPTPDGKTLVISSWQSNAVQVYDLEEQLIKRIIDGNRPICAMMFGGDLVVSELLTHSVVAISPDGERRTLAKGLEFLGTGEPKETKAPAWLQRAILGTVSTFSAGMVYPSGLAAQGKSLFAADWYRGEIYQIVADGEILAKPKVVAKGLEQPEGMAVAKDGSLLVIESKIGRLVKINPASGEKTVIAENLKTGEKAGFKAVPSYLFSGVAVGSDGSI